MKAAIETKIKSILHNKGYETTIDIESDLRKDVGLDSLDTIELIMELETAYSLTIPAEVSEKFVTVGDVIEYLADKVAYRI